MRVLPPLPPADGSIDERLAAELSKARLRAPSSAPDRPIDLAPSAERFRGERAERRALASRVMSFGIGFLDDALCGILPNDFILLAAPTGAGKTQLATGIAGSAARLRRRVLYLALEAARNEIEQRLKYRALVSTYYDSLGPRGQDFLSYRRWYMGDLEEVLGPYENHVEDKLAHELSTLTTVYRGATFTVDDIEQLLIAAQDDVDLVVIDHLHYIDAREDESENRAFKEITKRLRELALRVAKPVIAVAHLRKRDRTHRTLMPSLDDVHGSSDITKITTQCIVMAPAFCAMERPWLFGTYLQVIKDRLDGAQPWVAKLTYDARVCAYRDEYQLGRANAKEEWMRLSNDDVPPWAKRCVRRSLAEEHGAAEEERA